MAASAVLLLLTGCVPTREIPTGGPTDAEYERWLDSSADAMWNALGADDALRPPKSDYIFVEPANWVGQLVTCMNDRGYAEYIVNSDGSFSSDAGMLDGSQEIVDYWECQTIYQVDPREFDMPGGDVLDYLYDYNRSVLVPCLEAHGETVSFAPTREQAATVGGEYSGWNPYFWNWENFSPKTNARDKYISEACPPFPAGEQFDEMREIWR